MIIKDEAGSNRLNKLSEGKYESGCKTVTHNPIEGQQNCPRRGKRGGGRWPRLITIAIVSETQRERISPPPNPLAQQHERGEGEGEISSKERG